MHPEPHALHAEQALHVEQLLLQLELLQVEQRKLKALSWLIRSERDGVLVSEESRLTGRLPSRPVDDLKLRRLELQAAPGGGFCFPAGLM